jgi:hypothetical protein
MRRCMEKQLDAVRERGAQRSIAELGRGVNSLL